MDYVEVINKEIERLVRLNEIFENKSGYDKNIRSNIRELESLIMTVWRLKYKPTLSDENITEEQSLT